MQPFVRSARFYDLLYHEKDYVRESQYVESLARKYSSFPVRSLFELGCGTGRHAEYFCPKGTNCMAST